MRVAVLSGKGGAGKTMVAVNLAAACGAMYMDCDVEEPNGRIFLKPEGVESSAVHTLLPEFDADKCTGCRKCVDFCRFHALIYIRQKPKVFAEVCHNCGGCALVCPEGAVSEAERPVGRIEEGSRGELRVVTGVLDMGEASGVPVIREVLARRSEGMAVIDCPPGSACSVMESVMGADYALLVAEPTAFGFHNFKMVHRLVSLLKKPCGVIINKQEQPYEPLERFCEENALPILMRVPYSSDYAALSAQGKLLVEEDDRAREMFESLSIRIGGEAV